MAGLIAWCGFLGAWLLVAGPVHQAALELQEEDSARDAMAAATDRVGETRPVSAWWWLLPPARYVQARRRQRRFRRAVVGVLTPGELASLVRYVDRAAGWLFVAGGGFLLAAEKTWELSEHEQWPAWAFWAALVVMAGLALGPTVARTRRRPGARGGGPRPSRRQ